MKKLRLIHLLFLLISRSISAQINLRNSIENVSYEKPVEYEIAGITIQGITNLDKNAIITLSGLTVGDKIMIPGEEISKAITKLWAQNLFADIQIQVSKILGTNIFLDLVLQELPRLSKFGFKGGSKSEEKIREKVELVRGKIVNDNLINNTKHVVKEYFTEKGFLNANVSITQITDTAEVANVILEINIDKGEKIKINEINFNGVTKFKIKKLKRQLKDTKEKSFFRIFKTSKFRILLY